MNHSNKHPHCIGLALGSGSARGWSHIGILKALAEIGIEPDIICGCSIGALVGASYVTGNINQLEQWVLSLTKLEVAKFFELNLSLNGFVNIKRLSYFMKKYVCNENLNIENLEKQFAAVATELETGREIWFKKGSLIKSVQASISIPGIFPPVQNQGEWLVDGGLVNPVPISLCRALGADIVIAVNLNGDIVGKRSIQKTIEPKDRSKKNIITKTIKEYSHKLFLNNKESTDRVPGLFESIAKSINIAQYKITNSRIAGDPPDILLTPKLSHIGLLEFYRSTEAIREGTECVKRMLPEIKYQLRIV